MSCMPPDRDTIAAVATAPGRAGIAVIRLSGPDSLTVARSVFSGVSDLGTLPRHMVYGRICDGSETLDEALVCFMPGPRSYTGDDVVEIQVHGGSAAAESVLSLLSSRGARPAEPGEFTRRAFLNGRIDLAQAESVMEIVGAEGRESLRLAGNLMSGKFSGKVRSLSEEIVALRTQIELSLDFSDQETEPPAGPALDEKIAAVIDDIDSLIGSYETSRRIRSGVTVVIAGKVNTGKSSLFNRLAGRKRAIVHDRPGTTRDWIEERIELDGIPINLIDTAGLRPTDDEVEREGVRETNRLLDEADAVLFLEDVGEMTQQYFPTASDNSVFIRAVGKSDLIPVAVRDPDRFYLSSVTGEGIERCRERLAREARNIIGERNSEPIVMVARHRDHFRRARGLLEHAREFLGARQEEIAAEELAAADRELGAILGSNVSADVIESVFKNFCIGK